MYATKSTQEYTRQSSNSALSALATPPAAPPSSPGQEAVRGRPMAAATSVIATQAAADKGLVKSRNAVGNTAVPTFQSFSTRAWILICFYCTIFASLPIWLKTTTIERLALPQVHVEEWETHLPCPIRFRHTVTLKLPIGIADAKNDDVVARELARGLNAASDGVWVTQEQEEEHDRLYNNASAVINGGSSDRIPYAKPTPMEHAACIDWNVRLSESAKLEPSSMHYVITLTNGDATDSFLSTSTTRRFSLNMHAQLDGKQPAEMAFTLAWQLSHILQLPYRDLFFHAARPTLGEASLDALSMQNVLQHIDRRETDKRMIPYTQDVRLVFSLINEDSTSKAPSTTNSKDRTLQSGVAGWDAIEAQKAISKRIGPLVEALQGTHRIVTELQAIWFAPLSFDTTELRVPRDPQSGGAASKEAHKQDDTDEVEEKDRGTDEDGGQSSWDVQVKEQEHDTFHVVGHDDLQIFVDVGEWGLTAGGSSSSSSSFSESVDAGDVRDELRAMVEQNERTLHFIVYVPKPDHRPLRIASNAARTNVSQATAWLVPQWGGVSLYNLGFEEAHTNQATSAADSQRNSGNLLGALSSDELDKAFSAFSKQLSTLLGLRRDANGAAEAALPSADARLAVALDALARRRILGAVRESVRTLGSIVRLVDKIKVLGVGSEVRDDVGRALTMLQRAYDASATHERADNTRDNDAAGAGGGGEMPFMRQGAPSSHSPTPLSPLLHLLQLAYSAELFSSRAFFNPAMLGQLYFPDEHKYAVYTPLFGPLAMPLLVAGLRLIKERRKRKRLAAAATPTATTTAGGAVAVPRRPSSSKGKRSLSDRKEK